MIKVYLAGKMGGLSLTEMGQWRVETERKLRNAADYIDTKIRVINPITYYNFEEVRYQNELEVQNFDLNHVITSDVIVVNLEGLSSSVGTIIELHDASYHHRIPVIAFGDKKLYNELHPWIQNSITRVEKDIDDVVTYISDFYLI